jgi:hypothetical protein
VLKEFAMAKTVSEKEKKNKWKLMKKTPIPVVARSKAWVCGRSLVGTAGSNPAGCVDVCLL